jgi:GxxExxY protein
MAGEERDAQTYAIIGAALEVHNCLGGGFLENVYQEAMTVELGLAGLPFERELALPIVYKGLVLNCSYRADFVCFSEVIVEIKALDRLTSVETAQVINYLKATGLNRALLINFGGPQLEHRRFVRDYLRVPACGRSASSADRVREVSD